MDEDQIQPTAATDLAQNDQEVNALSDQVILLRASDQEVVRTSIASLPFTAGGGEGGNTGGGQAATSANVRGQAVEFNIPAIATITAGATAGRFTPTATATPIYYHLSAFEGTGVAGVATTSVVDGKARVTIVKAGNVDINYLQRWQINRTSVRAASRVDLECYLTHWRSGGDKVKDYQIGHFDSEDTLNTAVIESEGGSVALIPVQAGDYFTIKWGLTTSYVGNWLSLSIPTHDTTKPPHLDFNFYPYVSPTQEIGDLTFTPVARIDVDHTALGVDLKTAPSPRFQAGSTAVQHSVSATEGFYFRADGGHVSPRLKLHSITGSGKEATIQATPKTLDLPASFTIGASNDWGFAVDDTRIVAGYASSTTQAKIHFGDFNKTARTITWASAALTITLPTGSTATAESFDLALNPNTLIVYRKTGSLAQFYSCTMSGSGKDTTITAVGTGANITSDCRAIDCHDERFVYAVGGTSNRIGVANISGTGSSASVGQGILTALGNRDVSQTIASQTLTYAVSDLQGVAWNGTTFFVELGYNLTSGQTGVDAKRRYSWIGFIAGGADVAHTELLPLDITLTEWNNDYSSSRLFAGTPTTTSGTLATYRLARRFGNQVILLEKLGSRPSRYNDPFTHYRSGTITGGALAVGSRVAIPNALTRVANASAVAFNSELLIIASSSSLYLWTYTGSGQNIVLGSRMTLTSPISSIGQADMMWLDTNNIFTLYQSSTRKISTYEIVISGNTASAILTEETTLDSPITIGAASDYAVYQVAPNSGGAIGIAYVSPTVSPPDNWKFRQIDYNYNLITTQLVPQPPTGYSVLQGGGLTGPLSISDNIVRGYRIRAYLEVVGSADTKLGELYFQSGIRGNDGQRTYGGHSYFTDTYTIQTTPNVVAQIVYGLRVDAVNEVIQLQSYIGRILGTTYFSVDAITGTGQIPGSTNLVGFDIEGLELAPSLEDTDKFAIYRPSADRDYAITIATMRSVLVRLTGGLTANSVVPIITTQITTQVSPWARGDNSDPIPTAKLGNANAITHISTSFLTAVGKSSDKLFGDGGTDNLRVAYKKTYDSKISLVRPDQIEGSSAIGVSGDRGVIRPNIPQGFISLETSTDLIKLVIATNTTNLLDSDTATFRVQYRNEGDTNWNTYNLPKNTANSNATQTEYRFSGTIVPMDAGELNELRISANAGTSYLDLHTGSYINVFLDYDNFQTLMAGIIADLRAHATSEAGKIDGDYIVAALKARTETKKLPYSAIQGNPELQEVTTLPDLDDVEVGAVVVQKKGDNHLIKYVSPDTEITTPDRNKITITLSQQRIFWYGDGGTGVSVRNYNGFVGRYEVTILGSIRYVRLYLRADMLAGLGISLSTENTCFQAAVAVPGGTKTYLTYIRTASSETVAGHQYWEYWSSQGDPTGRPNAQGATYDIFFRNPANSANINIFPEKTLGKGWVSTDKNTDAIIAQIKAAIGNAKLPSTAITGPPIVPEFSSLPATAGYTGGEVIVLKTGNNRDFYTLTSQSQTVTNRDQIQVATGISVADGFDAGGNAINKIAYDADLPDDAEGGRAVRNYQMFIGYLQRQTISTGPNQYTMLLYLREDMLAGIGIDAGAPSASVRFKAAFTTASEAKTYLDFTRTPQTDYILGHQYLGFTSVASTPPSTTGYPESASTTYTISFQTSAGAPLNIWPQTLSVPDAWVAVPSDVASWAETSNTDRIPEEKSRIVLTTQANYNTLVAAGNDEDRVIYAIY